jgi:hypothetical protein
MPSFCEGKFSGAGQSPPLDIRVEVCQHTNCRVLAVPKHFASQKIEGTFQCRLIPKLQNLFGLCDNVLTAFRDLDDEVWSTILHQK